jgi:uncharacterized protein (TIGR02145 family)
MNLSYNVLRLFNFITPLCYFLGLSPLLANQNKLPIAEIKIGNQVWMTANLNVETFKNGDPIAQIKSKKEWRDAGKTMRAGWCNFDTEKVYGLKYGKLYNWFAVNDPRGLAPEGWHIPSIEEWQELIQHLGGPNSAGTALKSKEHWYETGNNSSGFNAIPSGFRNADGIFGFMGEYAKWWCSTEGDTKNAWCYYMTHTSKLIVKYYMAKSYGLSIRCIKDSPK